MPIDFYDGAGRSSYCAKQAPPAMADSSSTMSIKDRIAALKSKEAAAAIKSPSEKKDEVKPDEVKEGGGPARRPSIADRIAAMKAQSAAASPPPVFSAAPKSMPPLKTAAVTSPEPSTSPVSEQSDVDRTLPPKTGDGACVDESPKKSSIADRIAAMKQSGAGAGPPLPVKVAPVGATKSPMANRELPPVPQAEQPEAVPESNAACAPLTPGEQGRKSSIADRIAALKATGPAAAGGGVPIQAAPSSDPKRRLSIERSAFAQGLNLAALNPGAPRPPMFKPPTTDAEDSCQKTLSRSSCDEPGEMSHMSMSRAAVPSVKRKKAVTSVRLSPDWQTLAVEDLAALSLSSATFTTTTACETTGSESATIVETEEEHAENETTSVTPAST